MTLERVKLAPLVPCLTGIGCVRVRCELLSGFLSFRVSALSREYLAVCGRIEKQNLMSCEINVSQGIIIVIYSKYVIYLCGGTRGPAFSMGKAKKGVKLDPTLGRKSAVGNSELFSLASNNPPNFVQNLPFSKYNSLECLQHHCLRFSK